MATSLDHFDSGPFGNNDQCFSRVYEWKVSTDQIGF